MDNTAIYWIAIFLAASAFFSASETSLFSLNRLHLKKLENSSDKTDKRIIRLLAQPRLLLITVLLGNTIVNITISSFATMYSLYLKKYFGWLWSDSLIITIQVLVTTAVILLLGEIIPKLTAWAKAYRIARIVSIPLNIIEILLWPILKLLVWISQLLSSKTNKNDENQISTEEFQTLIDSESTKHNLEEHEKKILKGLFRLPKAEIREIIIPRVHITAIEAGQTIDDLKTIIIESGFSRIPVFKETIDDIIGVIYAKDILLHPELNSIDELMRPAWFVTENMKIQALLNQFKSKKTQIAIVVDEYGGTSGIITLEDIMEELVGDIQDEYDIDEIPAVERISDNILIVTGMYSVRELNNEMNIDINPEKYDNIADFILELFNRIPAVNETINYLGKVEFKILDSDKQRINKILIKRLAGDQSHIEE